MSNEYLTFEVNLDALKLPLLKNISNFHISSILNQHEFNEFLDLFKKIFPNELDSEKENEFRSYPQPNFKGIYIAKIDNKIVGFLITGIINFVEPLGYILYLGVDEKYRHKGIATALLYEFKKYLSKNNIEKIQAKIKKDNYVVLKYIDFLGFKRLK